MKKQTGLGMMRKRGEMPARGETELDQIQATGDKPKNSNERKKLSMNSKNRRGEATAANMAKGSHTTNIDDKNRNKNNKQKAEKVPGTVQSDRGG